MATLEIVTFLKIINKGRSEFYININHWYPIILSWNVDTSISYYINQSNLSEHILQFSRFEQKYPPRINGQNENVTSSGKYVKEMFGFHSFTYNILLGSAFVKTEYIAHIVW